MVREEILCFYKIILELKKTIDFLLRITTTKIPEHFFFEL